MTTLHIVQIGLGVVIAVALVVGIVISVAMNISKRRSGKTAKQSAANSVQGLGYFSWEIWRERLKKFWDRFDKTLVGLIFVGFLYVILRVFFPSLADRVYGSPLLVALTAAVVFGFIWFTFEGKVRLGLATALAVVLLFAGLKAFGIEEVRLPFIAPKPIQKVCDTAVRNVTIGNASQEVNPGGECSFTFEVVRGCVVFEGPSGPTDAICAGQPAFGMVRKRVITARATTTDAELEYLLCMPGSPVTGWRCS